MPGAAVRRGRPACAKSNETTLSNPLGHAHFLQCCRVVVESSLLLRRRHALARLVTAELTERETVSSSGGQAAVKKSSAVCSVVAQVNRQWILAGTKAIRACKPLGPRCRFGPLVKCPFSAKPETAPAAIEWNGDVVVMPTWNCCRWQDLQTRVERYSRTIHRALLSHHRWFSSTDEEHSRIPAARPEPLFNCRPNRTRKLCTQQQNKCLVAFLYPSLVSQQVTL